MQSKRFKLDIARREFDCYDCRHSFESGSQFAWDNTRNCKICSRCLDKLSKMVGSDSDDSLSENTTKKKVYWDVSMLPTRPWVIGNYDINSWPIEIQREYGTTASAPDSYVKGLAAARNKLSSGTDNCFQCVTDQSSKQSWTADCGSTEDWILRLYMETTKEGTIKVWTEINMISWSSTSMKELTSAYLQHLANIVSQETWTKPFRGLRQLTLD